VACVVPAAGVTADATLTQELVNAIRETLGGLARPSAILYLDHLGDDLDPAARRRGLERLAATADQHNPAPITWAQVHAAAQI